jgi:methylphosphotriester-DNA--protein-cysteine methyltransferase
VSRDRAKVEDRVARVIRKLESNKPVAKRDRGLQQLFEQATGDPATVHTAFAEDAQYTLKADPAARRSGRE